MAATIDFIIGRAGTGKTEACLSAMHERIERDPLGAPLIMLLPEHMTYKAERELAMRISKGHGFMRAYIFGFRRFARHVLMETGALSVPRISEVGRRILLRKLLMHHAKAKDLVVFGRAVRQRGFTESLSDIIKECKRYRLTSDVLRETADRLSGQERLAGKLREMALLGQEFEVAMAGKANDAEDMMERLAALLPQASLMEGAEVWIDGFTFFNPQEMEVLCAVCSASAHVHITLPMAGAAEKGGVVSLQLAENEQEAGLFHRAYLTYHAICRMAREELAIRERLPIHLRTDTRRYAPQTALPALERQLFQIGVSPIGQKDGVCLAEMANRRIEVECVAADILRLVREEDWHYRDIGVLVRDADAYDNLIRLILADYAIPFFSDSKRQSIHHPLAELMRAAIEVVTKNWAYETVFRYLRAGFSPLVREDIDKLENYVLEFGIRGRKRWQQQEMWGWHRRYTLDSEEKSDADTASLLAQIDGMRRQGVEALAAFEQAARAAHDVRAITGALYDLLIALGVPERLTEWTSQAEKDGRLADAAEHRQVWSGCMDLFDQLVEISGTEQISLADYGALLSDGLDAMELSLIPPGLDYVTVASFDQNSLENSRGIYILGADGDTMPRRIHEQGVLSDADRLHIDEAFREATKEGAPRREISHGGRERSLGEKFLLYHAFTEAREYLWVSYALADSEGNGIQPASLVKKMRAMLPKDVRTLSVGLEIIERKDDLQLSAPRPALSGLANALREQRDLQEGAVGSAKIPAFWCDVYNWARGQKSLERPLRLALAGLFATARGERQLPTALAGALFAPRGVLRGSVTQFEKFRQCPFSHFASYGLRLMERRTYQFREMDLGQLLHAVLRGYSEIVKASYGNDWASVPVKERSALCGKLVDEIAPRLQSEILLSRDNYRHLKQRIRATAERAVTHLSAWAAVSKFQPAFFEETFGHAGDQVKLTPLPLEGGYSLSFKGQIDRLDIHTSENYYLIVDYKTGGVALNLFEVYYGLKLQLLVYMMVGQMLLHQKGKDCVPAGMLYALVQNPLIVAGKKRLDENALQKELKRKLCMPGWVLADIDVAQAIDSSLSFIKPGLKKADGKKGKTEGDFTFNENSKKYGYIRTQEEFRLMLEYVAYILRDTGNLILSGAIQAHPYRDKKAQRNACTFCPYSDVCGFDPEIAGYAYCDVEKESDVSIEVKMAEKTGREDLLDAIHGSTEKGNRDEG